MNREDIERKIDEVLNPKISEARDPHEYDQYDDDEEEDDRDPEVVFEDYLLDHIQDLDVEGVHVARVYSFEDVGVLTRNRGIVVKMDDGSEYQLTIVKSRQ